MKFLSVSALALCTATSVQAMTISNLANENSSVGNWGLADTAFYGQSITLGAAATLESVLFRINDLGTSILYDLYVLSVDTATDSASGPNLASVSGSTAGANGMMSEFIATGGIDLGIGEWLVGFQATSTGRSRWGHATDVNSYADGQFYFQNNSGNAALLTASPLEEFVTGDLAFELEFGDITPVPVPAGLPLLVTGLGILGFAARRRKS